MTDRKKRFDVEQALDLLAEIERTMDSRLTEEEREFVAARARTLDGHGGQRMFAPGEEAEAEELFDLVATRDALGALVEKMDAALELKQEKLYAAVLEIFYALEEALARDPANEDLKKQVDQLRAAHLQDYGKPIPPKKGR